MNQKNNKVCCWILAAIGIFIFLSFVGTGLVITALVAKAGKGASVSVKPDSYLVMELSGVLNEYEPAPQFDFLGGGRASTVSDILRALERARDDERIKGVVLRPMGVAGFAEIRELRRALSEFRKSGKPVYAHLEIATDRDYYLATAADSIIMSPSRSGGLALLGLSIESTYLARTFEKLGIKFYTLHVGEYKGAFENFSSDRMSGALRESLQLLLDDMYRVYTGEIVESRPALTKAQLDRELLQGEHLLIVGQQAVDMGLVDVAMDWGDFRERLKTEKDEELHSISPARYVKALETRGDAEREIAVVFAQGAISHRRAEGDPLSLEEGIEADVLVKQLRELREDEDVAAVVLRVNSPGGSAYASELILQEVKRLKAEKPVVVSMGNVAASGGYYISCLGDHIIAHPNTVTGSIGVVSLFPSAEQLYRKIGANVEVVERGKWASYFRLDRDLTAEQQQVILGYMTGVYDEFVGRVAEGRKLAVDDVRAVAEGRVWTGSQALERKLVDELGDLDLAIVRARELAKEDSVSTRVSYYPREKSFVKFLMEHFGVRLRTTLQSWTILPEQQAVRRATEYLDRFMRQREYVQLVVPFELP